MFKKQLKALKKKNEVNQDFISKSCHFFSNKYRNFKIKLNIQNKKFKIF